MFIEIVNKYKHKSNKLWVNQEREFCDSPVREWLENNIILIYSTYHETKSVVAERFIRTLKGL